VSWDHFDDFARCVSARLLISLAADAPHVTTYHDGDKDIVEGSPGLDLACTVDEAAAKMDFMLGRSRKQLIEEGKSAFEWTGDRLDAVAVYRHAIEICMERTRRL